MRGQNLQIKERIEACIISKDGCWLTKYTGGRPKIRINGKNHLLARKVYEVYKSVSPGNMLVCHTCDNPHCINPEHLFLGTHKDNMLDRNRKGRQAKGSRHGHAKLTETQVMKIRDLLSEKTLRICQIAEIFGVKPGIISDINTGKKWTHVQGIGARINLRRSNAKLNDDQVKQIKKMLFEGISTRKIGQQFGVDHKTIVAIRQNKTWVHISFD